MSTETARDEADKAAAAHGWTRSTGPGSTTYRRSLERLTVHSTRVGVVAEWMHNVDGKLGGGGGRRGGRAAVLAVLTAPALSRDLS